MTARLSLLDSSEQQESPWADHEHSHAGGAARPISVDPPHDPSPWGSQHSIKISAPQEIYLMNGQINPYAPAAVVESSDSQVGGSYGLQPPHAGGRLGSDAGINTPSMISTATSATSHELIDLEIPSGALGSESGFQQGQSSVYASDEFGGKGGKTQSDSRLPTKDLAHDRAPPLPSRNLSPTEAARQKEQRAETYSIRQINWTNREGTLLQSPILVQNKNGPCPLLALINALVLRADPNSQPPIVRALKSREQISLGLLIEALFEELTTCLGPDEEFPDIEALTQFLTMLHTGMNVNPRLTLVGETGRSLNKDKNANIEVGKCGISWYFSANPRPSLVQHIRCTSHSRLARLVVKPRTYRHDSNRSISRGYPTTTFSQARS